MVLTVFVIEERVKSIIYISQVFRLMVYSVPLKAISYSVQVFRLMLFVPNVDVRF